MVALFDAYWPVVLIGLLIGLVIGYLIFRPRQRVRLSDNRPLRPHMAATPSERRGVASAGAAAMSDVAGPMIGTKVHPHLPGASGPPDDLEKLKGVGPKLASILNAHGLTRFDQIAKLSHGEIERLNSELGAFRGRLTRDRIVEQADYLARGDIDGFEHKFGRL